MSISGKKMGMWINGSQILDNYAWTADEGGDVLDRTVGANNGWEAEDMGVQNLHVTAKLYLDIGSGQYLEVRRGTVLSSVELYVDLDDVTPAYNISEALVVRSSRGGEVRGKLEITVEFHSRGDVVTASEV